MAREATITQEQVNAAADTIRATGTKPTARAVRDALGTGSMATVLKFLQVWQAGQVRPAAQDVTLPPVLIRGLVDFIGQEVAQAKAGLEADLATAQQAAADLIAEAERQAATIDAQEKFLDESRGDKAELIGKLGQMEADLTAARDEAERERQAAEVARVEIAKVQIRVEDQAAKLEAQAAELASLKTALAASEKARQAAEQNAAVVSAKLEACESSGVDLRERMGKAEARAEKAEQLAQVKAGELATANVTIQAGQARLEAAERELTSARKSADEARAASKTAGEEAAELKGELTATRAALKKAGEDLAAARKEKK